MMTSERMAHAAAPSWSYSVGRLVSKYSIAGQAILWRRLLGVFLASNGCVWRLKVRATAPSDCPAPHCPVSSPPMAPDFFQQPILNSPYERPGWHWELDDSGQPTGREVGSRRPAKFVSPIPQPKKRSKASVQAALDLGDDAGPSTAEQRYGEAMINDLRARARRR